MISLQHYQKHKLQYPQELTPIEMEEYPEFLVDERLVMVWVSRKYLVQMYEEGTVEHPHMKRLSICRVKRNQHGWVDGLTWDELQAIKREVGYSDWFAVEIYPRDADVINVANFRHLWLLETPLSIGWRKEADNA